MQLNDYQKKRERNKKILELHTFQIKVDAGNETQPDSQDWRIPVVSEFGLFVISALLAAALSVATWKSNPEVSSLTEVVTAENTRTL